MTTRDETDTAVTSTEAATEAAATEDTSAAPPTETSVKQKKGSKAPKAKAPKTVDAASSEAPTAQKMAKLKNANSKAELSIQEMSPHFDPDDLTLIEDPAHPLYDPRIKLPVDDRLVTNISRVGVLEPVLVRVVYQQHERIVEVVDGRQRVKAARKANQSLRGKDKVRIPVVTYAGDERKLREAMYSTFIRQDDTPVQKAEKAMILLNDGYDVKGAAEVMGCTAQTIRNYKHMLALSPRVQKAIDSGEVNPSHVMALHTLEHDKQDEALQKMLDSGSTKGRKAKAQVDKARGKKNSAPTSRMRNRALIEDAMKRVKKSGKYQIAYDVLRWVLGHDKIDGPLATLLFGEDE